jgi:hypothetical protein
MLVLNIGRATGSCQGCGQRKMAVAQRKCRDVLWLVSGGNDVGVSAAANVHKGEQR